MSNTKTTQIMRIKISLDGAPSFTREGQNLDAGDIKQQLNADDVVILSENWDGNKCVLDAQVTFIDRVMSKDSIIERLNADYVEITRDKLFLHELGRQIQETEAVDPVDAAIETLSKIEDALCKADIRIRVDYDPDLCCYIICIPVGEDSM